MKDVTYIKENGLEYKNPAKKLQNVVEGGVWQVTGRKQDAGNLTHFGYQVLPKLLQEWFKGHNIQSTRDGMTPGMRR